AMRAARIRVGREHPAARPAENGRTSCRLLAAAARRTHLALLHPARRTHPALLHPARRTHPAPSHLVTSAPSLTYNQEEIYRLSIYRTAIRSYEPRRISRPVVPSQVRSPRLRHHAGRRGTDRG